MSLLNLTPENKESPDHGTPCKREQVLLKNSCGFYRQKPVFDSHPLKDLTVRITSFINVEVACAGNCSCVTLTSVFQVTSVTCASEGKVFVISVCWSSPNVLLSSQSWGDLTWCQRHTMCCSSQNGLLSSQCWDDLTWSRWPHNETIISQSIDDLA